jgi:hypothetical protein
MDARVPLELRHHSNIASGSDFRCSDELAFTLAASGGETQEPKPRYG